MMGEREIMAAASIGATDENETSRLRESIAETRESIGNTIEALQEKLSPGALAEQAKTAVREATIGKVENMVHDAEETIQRTGYSVYDSIRRNPVPLAMAGLGLVWFFTSHRREHRHFMEESHRGEEGHRGGRRVRGEGITTRVREAAHEVAGKAERLEEGVESKVTEAARGAKEKVKQVAHDAGETGRRIERRLEDKFYDNPLAAGAIALAAGTAIGLAIPISRKEEEWMGPTRDKLVGKANELAQQAIGKVEEAASKVQDVAGKVEGAARDVGQSTSQALGQGGTQSPQQGLSSQQLGSNR